ncbi:MAG TPA: hypothetical protein VHL77_10205, partial [Ferruginibacter sp.]|nr:hypothetical protein [Ferruginibacter sp.]
MTIVVSATDEQWNDLNRDGEKADWQRVDDTSQFDRFKEADAFFSLKDNSIPDDFADLKKPVFINSVIETLSDLNAPENIFRINGWATFLSRPAWEIAGKVDEQCRRVFHALNIKINPVPDEPGFISA